MRFLSKDDTRRAQGGLILGLGMIFFGMGVMGEAMDPLSDYEPFRDWMAGMSNPVAGIVAGAVFTAVIQSSSATTGVVLALAFEGLIGIEAGIALILGANVGTSVTAQLAAIGKPRDALRAAWVHTIFNVLGVLIWVMFIPQLADLVQGIGVASPGRSPMPTRSSTLPIRCCLLVSRSSLRPSWSGWYLTKRNRKSSVPAIWTRVF